MVQFADEVIAAIAMRKNVGDELRQDDAALSRFGLRLVVDRLSGPGT